MQAGGWGDGGQVNNRGSWRNAQGCRGITGEGAGLQVEVQVRVYVKMQVREHGRGITGGRQAEG